MEGGSFSEILWQLPIVGLFFVFVYYASKYIERMMDRRDEERASLLLTHQEERIKRDQEWRDWLQDHTMNLNQYQNEARREYLAHLDKITLSIDKHDRTITQLLVRIENQSKAVCPILMGKENEPSS